MALNDDIQALPDAVASGDTGRLARTGTVYQALKSFLTTLGTKLTVPTTPVSAGTDIGTLLSNLGLRAAGSVIWAQQNSFNALAVFSAAVRFTPATRTAAATLSGTSVTHNLCDATAAAFAITLSPSSTSGQLFHIQKIDSSANAVTVSAASGQTINGASTYPLATKGKRVTVLSDGTTDWKIVESN